MSEGFEISAIISPRCVPTQIKLPPPCIKPPRDAEKVLDYVRALNRSHEGWNAGQLRSHHLRERACKMAGYLASDAATAAIRWQWASLHPAEQSPDRLPQIGGRALANYAHH